MNSSEHRRSKRRAWITLTTAAAVVAAVTILAAPTQAAEEITQGVIASTGTCGNKITITGMDENGDAVATRTLVRPRPGFQMIPYTVTSKPTRLLYGEYDCANKTFRLFTLKLGGRVTPSLVAAYPSPLWLVDASWDVMNNQPVTLLRDADFNYVLSAGPTTLWQGSARANGLYLSGIDGRTGGEVLMMGDDLSGSWAAIRVGRGGSGVQLTGPGQGHDITGAILNQFDVFTTTSGTYVCDSLTSGTVEDALASGKCVRTDPGDSAAVAWAGGKNTYWVAVTPEFSGATMRTLVACPTGSLFACGRPVIEKPVQFNRGYVGRDLVWLPLFDIPFRSSRPANTPA